MKLKITKISVLVVLSLLLSNMTLQAQVDTFFKESFGAGSGNRAVSAHTFDNSAAGVTYSTNNTLNNLRTTTQSSSSAYSFASGDYNLFFPVRSTSGANGAITFTIDNIDISQYENVKLIFGLVKNSNAATADNFTITATVDNGTPINLAYAYSSSSNNAWMGNIVTTPITNGNILKLTFTRSGTVAVSAEYRLDDVHLLGTEITPLPLSLLNFEQVNESLQWSTAQEKNVSHFEVEVSDNASNFQLFNKVIASNSFGENSYELPVMLENGTQYYRLKIVDHDGSFTYSKVVRVEGRSVQPVLDIFPNPNATGHFQLTKKMKVINVYSMDGKLLAAFKDTDYFYFKPNVAGTYLVSFQDASGQTIAAKKIVVE